MNIKQLVKYFSEDIGERNYLSYKKLQYTKVSIISIMTSLGYECSLHSYFNYGALFQNIDATIVGTIYPEKIICIGAHYDTLVECQGANDNTSGLVGLLWLADYFKTHKPKCSLRFCFFVNEEPPFFNTINMGSYQYAKMCRDKNLDIKLIALDLIGYYTNEKDSQYYPPELIYKDYSTIANFISFIGSKSSENFLNECSSLFKTQNEFPIQSMMFPNDNFFSYCSDHGSFSKFDYESILVTDTAFLRYKHYHTENDTYDKLNYVEMERMLNVLSKMIEKILNN